MKKLIFIIIVCAFVTPLARADLFGFGAISNNSGVSGALTGQLCVDVTPYGTDQVLFTFYNNGPAPYQVSSPIPSTFKAVYFDDGTLFGVASLIEGPGVEFTQFGLTETPVLPGANGSPYHFLTSAGFGAVAGPPAPSNGVDQWEYLGIVFDLKEDDWGVPLTFDDVIAAIGLGLTDPLNENALRIGIHVISIGDNEESDAFIMTPVPGAVLLGMLGLGVAGIKLRKYA